MTGPAALDTELVAVDQLREHPENYNRGDDETMAELLTIHGQWRPAVVQRSTGYVLIGNTMLRAARDRLGWNQLNVHYRDVDADGARRILVADNRARDLSVSDDRALLALLATFDDDFTGTAVTVDDFDDLRAQLQELEREDAANPPRDPSLPYAASSGAYGTDGDGTNTRQTPSYSEYQTAYDQRATRFLALIYPLGQYAWLVGKMGKLADDLGVDSNSDVLLRLVTDRVGEEPPPEDAPITAEVVAAANAVETAAEEPTGS